MSSIVCSASEDRQAVLSGLAAGERVITGGLHKAAPGQTVSPVGLAEPGK